MTARDTVHHDTHHGTRWRRLGAALAVSLGTLGGLATLTWQQALGFDATVVIQDGSATFSSSQITADDAAFGMAPVRVGNGTWKNLLRAGFARAGMDGLCVSKTETVGPVKYTLKLTAGDGTSALEIRAADAGFDVTTLRGRGINLQGSTQIGQATTDLTTAPGAAPYLANPFGVPATYDGGFFGPGATGPQAYGATGNGGHVNGQGFTGIDATRGSLTGVYGQLWQAQVSGNITLPHLRIQVLPFKDDIGFAANGTPTTTPDGIDDRSCWTEARQGTFPR
ncbi:DUF6230 family protein [Nocardioides sp. R1-1]|uniref:DUF6230 family protein n=1 Tax=Nocardioides sp. R1-1 TaxID=3383502 RepID=UPI0038D1F954